MVGTAVDLDMLVCLPFNHLMQLQAQGMAKQGIVSWFE
jgi:hypothetical protein